MERGAEENVAGGRLPFLLAQRAASEGPRWTRAVKATRSPACRDTFRPGWRKKVEDEKDWKGIHVGLCAPGTRALGRASFDGRTWTNMRTLPTEGKKRVWRDHWEWCTRVPSGNGTPPPRHAPSTGQHQDRFARVPGKTIRIRLGCLRSREWRGASPYSMRSHQQGMCRA